MTTTRKTNPNPLPEANRANRTTTRKLIARIAEILPELEIKPPKPGKQYKRNQATRDAITHLAAYAWNNGAGLSLSLITDGGEVAKTSHNPEDAGAMVAAAIGTARIQQSISYLASANRSGLLNSCPWSTPECRALCLGHTSGRLQFNASQIAQIVRTRYLVEHTAQYLLVLHDEARQHAKRAHDAGAAWLYRPNGDSEIVFDQIPQFVESLASMAPDPSRVFFQDYAKRPEAERAKNLTPARYWLAPSATERTIEPEDYAPYQAVVVNIRPGTSKRPAEPLPTEFMGRPVIDGDADNSDPTAGPLGHGDMRALDAITHPVEDPELAPLVLLRMKGKKAASMPAGPAHMVKDARAAAGLAPLAA